jgi:serine/threonine protein kinase/tetratricopeptide (TPR) repeat protein
MSTPGRIGRYPLVRPLGAGGMGEVWVALDDPHSRHVALKTIRDDVGLPARRDRVWREARAAASVSHPNICQVFEIAEENGELFLTMELLEGESLAERLKKGPIPLPEALTIAKGLLAGLGAIHERGLVHRDLKPANVFLTHAGPKILDFGLARSVVTADEPHLTRVGTVVGTPRYFAPEQLRGEQADARTDLFAAASIVYEMLSGRTPFEGSGPDLAHAILHENPPALTGSPSVVMADRVLRRALAKKREERPSSADELAHALVPQGTSAETISVAADARIVTRLVVLPFRVLKPDPEIDFLAVSLPDAITSSLSGLSALSVRSPMTAARFAGADLDVKRIASEMEVDLVLTGTLLSAGGKLRLSTQLLEAPSGTVLWSQTSVVPAGDVFALEDDLVKRVVESLSAPLTAREHRMLGREVPASAKAYELYLRANELGRTSKGWEAARLLYEQCVAEDPNYAPAWARLGRVRRVLAKFSEADTTDLRRSAGEAFRRAFTLNPDLPLAHVLATYWEVENGHVFETLRRVLERLKTNPSDAELWSALVMVFRMVGLLDASLAAHEQTVRLDPGARTSVMITWAFKGELERALETEHGDVASFRQLALYWVGRREESLAELERLADAATLPAQRAVFVSIKQVLEGDAAAAAAYSSWLTANFHDPEGHCALSTVFFAGGQPELGIRHLEQAAAAGFGCVTALEALPPFAPHRLDARFVAVTEAVAKTRQKAREIYTEMGGPYLVGPLEDITGAASEATVRLKRS